MSGGAKGADGGIACWNGGILRLLLLGGPIRQRVAVKKGWAVMRERYGVKLKRKRRVGEALVIRVSEGRSEMRQGLSLRFEDSRSG